MKRLRVNVGKVGIITRNGDYRKVITSGVYWIGFNENISLYDMSKLYSSNIDLDIMIQDDQFRNLIEILDIKDHEIALKYVGNNYDSILTSGRYFYWKGLVDFKFVKVDLSKIEIDDSIDKSLLDRVGLSKFTRKYKVENFEEALLIVDGHFVKKLSKGTYYFWNNSISIEVLKADLRQLQLEIAGQEILTRDKAAIRVSFFTQYKVIDTEVALMRNKNYEKQLYILIQLALREFIGTMSIDELLENKKSITEYVLKILKTKSLNLGVSILDAGIKDIILPGEVKDIMNQVLVAQKQAQANIITRREETASTRSILNTAKLMEDNSMLFKLKEMEFVEKIAGKIGEITVSGNGKVIDQLKDIFTTSKN